MGAIGGRMGARGGRMGAIEGRMGAIGAIPRPSGAVRAIPGPMAPGDVFTGQGCRCHVFYEILYQISNIHNILRQEGLNI